ncbi:MAG: cellulase family glycosylhydrolase, partial [Verrucomicrobiota bacterium]
DSDVWISLWNEPYGGNAGDADAWLTDSAEMIDAIRGQSNPNIIVVPVANWAQDETVLFSKGNTLKSGRSNLLFDIHCYAGWNDWQTQTDVQNRFQAVKNAGFAAMVGEVGSVIGYWNNQWQVRDVAKILNAAANTGMTCLAWHWKN